MSKKKILILAALVLLIAASVLTFAIASPAQADGAMSSGMKAFRRNMEVLGLLDKTWCTESWYTTPNVCYAGLRYNWRGKATLAAKYSVGTSTYTYLGDVKP